MIFLLLGGCVRGEAAPVPHFAPLRPGAGYIALSRRRGSALYTGHPLGHRSARPVCFQAGSLRRWGPPTFLLTPPNLKEDGKSPQS